METRMMTHAERATFLAMIIESSGIYDVKRSELWSRFGWNGCSYQGVKMKLALERIGTTELEILRKFICLNPTHKKKLDEIICMKNIELDLACKSVISLE